MIKNAIVYKAKLPSAEALAGHLAEFPFQDLPETAANGAGFVPVLHGELVAKFTGGLAFNLRIDEKILPASVVNKETTKREAQIEKEQGFAVGRKHLREIKTQVYMELLARALVRSTVVRCFYHTRTGYLIVSTSNQGQANWVMNLLTRSTGAIETTTIHVDDVKGGLTTRLEKHLADGVDVEFPFNPFSVGNSVWLKHPESGEKQTFQLEDLASAGKAVRDAIAAGFKAEALLLGFNAVTFKLTSEFRLRSISFDHEGLGDDATDEIEQWEADAFLQVNDLAETVEALCNLLGYKDPAEGGEA